MKQVAVISGKGGTGKTSLVASLASLARPCVLADADVGAANLALLAPGEDQPWRPFLAGQRATVREEACIGCGTCAAVCRFGAVKLGPQNRSCVDGTLCEGCGACRLACPAEAVELEPRQAGTWSVRETALGPLVHARLGVGQGSSGKLVATVRDAARAEAARRGLALVLIDGPPGTGCPVHAAVTAVDLMIIVAEPTVAGLSALERALELAEHFRARVAVIINKHDLAPASTRRLEALAEAREAPVLASLPFDEEAHRALARGEPLLACPPLGPAIGRAWTEISRLLNLEKQRPVPHGDEHATL